MESCSSGVSYKISINIALPVFVFLRIPSTTFTYSQTMQTRRKLGTQKDHRAYLYIFYIDVLHTKHYPNNVNINLRIR